MTRIQQVVLMALTLLGIASCHETIHMHPLEEPLGSGKVLLTLHVDNDAPQLGAVIDYTVSPAVIIYSDDLPGKAAVRARNAAYVSAKNQNVHAELLKKAHLLSDALDEIAPYVLDGDQWKLHLRYEVYAGKAEEVGRGLATPIYSYEEAYRADTYHPKHDVELELPFGNVTVVAVAHIVPTGTDGDWFFNTKSLCNLICNMDKRQEEHDNVYRDCFVVGQEYYIARPEIEGTVQHLTATLTRPQGRYIVIADDYETYLEIAHTDIGHTVSHIYYPSYINVAYSVLFGKPIASSFDFGYDMRPMLVYAKESPCVRLGDDWSFVNGDRSNFNIDITVGEQTDGRIVSYNPNILVPIFPGRVTLVVGHWLTEINGGGGGIAIDPNFTDEIVIHF